jgi:Tfp pilus assembly protein PilF
MSDASPARVGLTLASLVLVVAIASWVVFECVRPRPNLNFSLPAPGSPVYEDYVDSFQVGVAAVDAGVPDIAGPKLTRAIELIPEEPAGWADRGLLYLRTNQMAEAERDLGKAHQLAPDNSDVEKLLGLLEENRGRFGEAATHFRRAIERDPHDVMALYSLARVINRERKPGSDVEYQQLLERILTDQPNNLHVLSQNLQAAVRRSDPRVIQEALARLRRLAPGWSQRARTAFAALEQKLAGGSGAPAVGEMVQFGNVLMAEPGYARSAAQVEPKAGLIGKPIETFLRLAPPRPTPAPADTGLAFKTETLQGAPKGRWDVAAPVWLTGEGRPVVVLANAKDVTQVGARTTLPSRAVSPDGFLALDWNNDFRTDLLLAGRDGLRFYQQGKDGTFADVTAKTGLSTEVLGGDYFGAWAADVDADGDLDIILARRSGPPLLLRNNLDGTFTPLPVFSGVENVRAFAWLDLDQDGAADAVLLDARGRLHIFANERLGHFREWPIAAPAGTFLALAVADVNDDGALDIVALGRDGSLVRISDWNKRAGWNVAELARWEPLPAGLEPGAVRLLTADLDNNGVVDLVASSATGSKAWLGTGEGKFQPLASALPPRLFAAADLDGGGRLDLLGLDDNGQPVRLRNAGTKKYHWQTVRLRSAKGDVRSEDRINSFGIGGEAEVRTGTFVVKKPIEKPVVHFGLGERPRADVLRINWPNGTFQAEFEQPIDNTVVAEQRLGASCPFLFTWDGQRFVFVTDFMWSSPLGVFESTGAGDCPVQTIDWVKIGGEQLKPRDGLYEVRVSANLWETHYYDRLTLVAVDHPADTALFVDERASLEPSQLAYHLVEEPRPVARAWDHHGVDVTAIVAARDGVYLDHCGRGTYPGVTHEHWVECDLGDDAPRQGPVWLIAQGWVSPVDSSGFAALAQGKHDQPREPVLEVPDGRGGWKVVRDKLGFPAGKNKTMLIRLDGVDGPGVPHRFRLRSNLEIYWDALLYARGRDDAVRKEHSLSPREADLHFRGLLDITRANASSPELPHYDRVRRLGQGWRDLIGFHTRYGDVRELLEKSDDRYVILCAGDELTLRFAAPAGPPGGWKRDFVWQCDGWTKDGDLNTRFSKTVLPLPYHGMKDYQTPPGRLEDDPVYRRFPDDWQKYHTRFVRPDDFERGLRPQPGSPQR